MIFEVVSLILPTLLMVKGASIESKDQTSFYRRFGNLNCGMESGWVTVDSIPPHGTEQDVNKFFYQLAYMSGKSSETVDPLDPLIIWLNGGPGCSSQESMYTEIGPFDVVASSSGDEEFELSFSDYSWNTHAHLLFVDQPFGAGLSWSTAKEIVNNTDLAASYFKEFLSIFLNAHPKLRLNPLYIFGESYGGHYVPAFARAILEDKNFDFVNYKGMGVASPWTDAMFQVNFGPSYAYSAGLVDRRGRQILQDWANAAQQDVLLGNYVQASYEDDEETGAYFAEKVQVNPFNIGQWVGAPGILEDEDQSGSFINSNKEIFGVPEFVSFDDCNGTIYDSFRYDWEVPRSEDVNFLLEKGKVLLFYGQLDMICHIAGGVAWINNLDWPKLASWKKENKKTLKSDDGTVFGTYKVHDNLSVATIYDSGHGIPYDQPEATKLLFLKYITDNWG